MELLTGDNPGGSRSGGRVDKEDILLRLSNLMISTPDVILDWDRLYEWMLFYPEDRSRGD